MKVPSKPQSLWKRIFSPIKYFVTFAMLTKHAIDLCPENDCVNKASVDTESPPDKQCNNSLQSISRAPFKMSFWKRFYDVIKFYFAIIIPKKHANERRFGDECLTEESVDCSSFQSLSLTSCSTYDQVFITDSDEMYQWVSKDTLMFRLFKCLERYCVFRFFLGGLISINPCWRSVLWVDEVINKSEPVEITDTLILHCGSIETYSKVIPRIRGSYHRLILHGHISWDQIKQLVHPGVKQVRINAKFDIESNKHAEFVCFIIRFCRGMSYKFSIAYEAKISLDLLKLIDNAMECTWGPHFLLLFKRGYDIIHFVPILIYFICVWFVLFVHACIFDFVSFYFAFNDNKSVFGFVIIVIVLIVVFYHMHGAPTDVKNKVQDTDFINTVLSLTV